MNAAPFIQAIYLGTVMFGTTCAMELPTIKALAMIESGANPLAEGKSGERTEFQIKKVLWDEIFKGQDIPFTPAYYHDNVVKLGFLMKWGQKYSKKFKDAQGRTPNDLEIYAMYNMGWTGFRKYGYNIQALPPEIRNRCMRFYNLVMLYESQN